MMMVPQEIEEKHSRLLLTLFVFVGVNVYYLDNYTSKIRCLIRGFTGAAHYSNPSLVRTGVLRI